jgi:hypothetical protein
MKRFLADLFLVFLGIAVIGLFGCAEPAPLEPDPTVPVEQCMTPFGQYYDCDGPVPPHPACLDSIPPCSIIPMPPPEE